MSYDQKVIKLPKDFFEPNLKSLQFSQRKYEGMIRVLDAEIQDALKIIDNFDTFLKSCQT